jgi:hypothetical protein
MKAVSVIFVVLALWSSIGHPATGSFPVSRCEIFNRASVSASPMVREYLSQSKDSFVQVCGDGDSAEFGAGGPVSREGNVCSFSLKTLRFDRASATFSKSNSGEQSYRLLSKDACASADSGQYAFTDSISAETFEQLVLLWNKATQSAGAFDKQSIKIDEKTRVRIANVLSTGRASNLRIVRALMLREAWLVKSYRLDIADLGETDRFFSATITKSLGSPYRISSIQLGIY